MVKNIDFNFNNNHIVAELNQRRDRDASTVTIEIDSKNIRNSRSDQIFDSLYNLAIKIADYKANSPNVNKVTIDLDEILKDSWNSVLDILNNDFTPESKDYSFSDKDLVLKVKQVFGAVGSGLGLITSAGIAHYAGAETLDTVQDLSDVTKYFVYGLPIVGAVVGYNFPGRRVAKNLVSSVQMRRDVKNGRIREVNRPYLDTFREMRVS